MRRCLAALFAVTTACLCSGCSGRPNVTPPPPRADLHPSFPGIIIDTQCRPHPTKYFEPQAGAPVAWNVINFCRKPVDLKVDNVRRAKHGDPDHCKDPSPPPSDSIVFEPAIPTASVPEDTADGPGEGTMAVTVPTKAGDGYYTYCVVITSDGTRAKADPEILIWR